MTNTIWCLFSVENEYNQPENNLVAWWNDKPTIEMILSKIGGNIHCDRDVVAAAHIYSGTGARHYNLDYRLQLVSEGVTL